MPDCAKTPTDPGCVAFYSTDQSASYALNQNALKQLLTQHSQNAAAAAATGGTSNINTNYTLMPGAGAAAIAASLTPWYKSWWGISLLAVAGVGAAYYYKTSKPKTV